EIVWDQRSLQDFESQPLCELAEAYDLMVIDYPHIGSAIKEELLVPLDDCGHGAELAVLATQSVGPSHRSYQSGGHQWALALDAATPVASFREDRMQSPPEHWEQVLELAKTGRVGMPLRAPHALIALIWVAGNSGMEIAATPTQFIEPNEMQESLEVLKILTDLLDPSCFDMDPIAVYESMSSDDAGPHYCPHAYGYVSYARSGFRNKRIRFTNVPAIGNTGPAGTALGGTGIAVSSKTAHRRIAADYAFWVSGAACQSTVYFESGGQPGNTAAWESQTCNATSADFFRNTRETLEGAWERPHHDGYLDFQEEGSHAVSAFLKEDAGLAQSAELVNTLYARSFA
ncbi:MAG: carbohydrate ABC transporter substrate-binding protein, partial [Alphaproteobacteria bacterium]|nr:carbohydrate ABC transporter substrate-binding protein [Alphaproteobacteria bacterium]